MYAGPGIYEDGSESTPIIILKKIIDSPEWSSKFVVYLNEKDPDNYAKLCKNVQEIENINSLSNKPIIKNKEINYNTPNEFNFSKIPCFTFIDPAGYSGLSLELLSAFGKDYGSDIIFFFNYNDINRALSNNRVTNNMRQLFGETHYSILMQKLNGCTGQIREAIIVNEMAEAIHDIGLKYVLPFRFKAEGKNRTSHYIIFGSKNVVGFNVMKDIMYRIGEKDFNGIGQFEFIPSCDKKGMQLSIIDLYATPFEEFKKELCERYKGRTVSMLSLYNEDSPNTRFVLKQYKKAMTVLNMSYQNIVDGKLERVFKEIDEQSYEPRVLKDLFEI